MSAKRVWRDSSFDPPTVAVLIRALELACRMASKRKPPVLYEIIARRLIKLAENGERDLIKLVDGARNPIIGLLSNEAS